MLVTNRPPNSSSDALNKAFDKCTNIVLATAYVSPDGCERLNLHARAQFARIRLVIGRAIFDGLPTSTKKYLLSLQGQLNKKGGGVRVCQSGFHSKLYAASGKASLQAAVGSSNLTGHGMDEWTEANIMLSGSPAKKVFAEALRLYDGAIDIDAIVDNIPTSKPGRAKRLTATGSMIELIEAEPGQFDEALTISLLDGSGEVPKKSGLNWSFAGGRPRDRFECYIPLPKSALDVAARVFGSARKGLVVRARTHDGRAFLLKLQGGNVKGATKPKQISTFRNNRELGHWMLGDCLGKKANVRITKQDLRRYGRTTVTFKRIGRDADGTALVYMDFSV